MKTIEPRDLKKRLDAGEEICLIDVREEKERALCHIGGTLIPLAHVIERKNEIPERGEVVIYCRSGGRSGRAIEALEQLGYSNLTNLSGGILAWSDQVDPSVQKY